MSKEPSKKTVNITVPIIVAMIGLIASIASALIGIYGGRMQESTKTVELLAEKFDSVDRKMSYEQALQLIYEDSLRMKQENKNSFDDNSMLRQESTKAIELLAGKFDYINSKMSYEQALQLVFEDLQRTKQENQTLFDDNAELNIELNALKNDKATVESIKSIANSGDYIKALSLLVGISEKTPEIEALMSNYEQKYETQIVDNVNTLILANKYKDAQQCLSEALLVLPQSVVIREKQIQVKSSAQTNLFKLSPSTTHYWPAIEGASQDYLGNIYSPDAWVIINGNSNSWAEYDISKNNFHSISGQLCKRARISEPLLRGENTKKRARK